MFKAEGLKDNERQRARNEDCSVGFSNIRSLRGWEEIRQMKGKNLFGLKRQGNGCRNFIRQTKKRGLKRTIRATAKTKSDERRESSRCKIWDSSKGDHEGPRRKREENEPNDAIV